MVNRPTLSWSQETCEDWAYFDRIVVSRCGDLVRGSFFWLRRCGCWAHTGQLQYDHCDSFWRWCRLDIRNNPVSIAPQIL